MKLIIVLALVLQILTACTGESTWPTTHFDPAKWMQTKEENRYVFVRDLISSKTLTDLSKRQVIELLGTPSYDDPSGDYVTYILKTDTEVHLLDIRFRKSQNERTVDAAFVRSA